MRRDSVRGKGFLFVCWFLLVCCFEDCLFIWSLLILLFWMLLIYLHKIFLV